MSHSTAPSVSTGHEPSERAARLILPVWPGAFHDPDLLPPGVCGSLRRKFVHPVNPVAQPARDGRADGVGLVGVDLDPGHAGKGQPRLGQSPRARGGIATPGESGVDPVAELDSTGADPPQVKAADHLLRWPGTQHVGVFGAVRPVCFGLAAAPALRLRIGGFFSSPGQPRPKMIQACADRVRELAGVRLSGSRQQAMRYFEHFGRRFGHLGIRCKPRSAPQVNFCGWRWRRPEAELTDMQ